MTLLSFRTMSRLAGCYGNHSQAKTVMMILRLMRHRWWMERMMVSPGDCHGHHAQTVDQLTPDVNGLRPEPLDQLVEAERVKGAGEGITGRFKTLNQFKLGNFNSESTSSKNKTTHPAIPQQANLTPASYFLRPWNTFFDKIYAFPAGCLLYLVSFLCRLLFYHIFHYPNHREI